MIDVVSYSPFQHQISGMHDNSAMSASQGARMSPENSIQALQPVPQEIHTSVIKKTHDHSVESLVPSLKLSAGYNNNNNSYSNQTKEQNLICDADDSMMDDDFSDHDSHYSEDLEDIDDEIIKPQPDMTKQLLDFADMVNMDINKFFGRKKGEDDSCDIYEDKWASTKSGRELYYADLMKIVHGEEKQSSKKKNCNSSPLLDISNSVKENRDNRNSFTGKVDKKLGIGPLNELFEYGLRHLLSDRKLKTKELKRLKPESKKFDGVLPMHDRKLPTSFWREPGSHQTNGEIRSNNGNSVLQTNNPPDFSDLLESWRLDRSEFSGEISSSEVSMSPESV